MPTAQPSKRTSSRALRRGAALSSAGLLTVVGLIDDGWTASGHRATGDRAARMHSSPQWNGKRFENPQPLWNDFLGMLTALGRTSPVAEPDAVPVVAMVEVCAQDKTWPDWHSGPEQAALANQRLRGQVFLPIHWGLWSLAMHRWTEPIERVLVAADDAGVTTATPRPEESVDPGLPLPQTRWWPDLPWQTAEEHPIVATWRR